MIITGTNAAAHIFTDTLDSASQGMIKALCDSNISKDSIIRIMPDVHAGKGCVIGTAMITNNLVTPGLLGGDIGCGITAYKLKLKTRPDLAKLDKVIRAGVPAGMKIHNEAANYPTLADECLENLKCKKHIQIDKAIRSLGTLGGGNHFIELGIENNKDYWLIVHSGSRHTGMEIAEYYHKKAYEQHGDVPYDFAYATDELMEDYLHDVQLLQTYAYCNRTAILNTVLSDMKWKINSSDESVIDCPHNFIEDCMDGDGKRQITLRKGAINATKDRLIIIPMNMRDGSLICLGKGNSEWNCSAPHGAGRIMNRSEAINSFTLTQYKKEMQGIFTTCITRDTIDESPMAYKAMADIVDKISPTADIISTIKPLYNFKAGGE